MKFILQKIFSHPALIDKPPVLIDIGASGEPPNDWKLITSYSICMRLDADTRDFSVTETSNMEYKKLYYLNRLIATKSDNEVDFFLTRSPYCSSSLCPDKQALKPWAFNQLFDVEKVVKMPAIDLKSALALSGIEYIDWYKTDSQGTDLRIFAALSTHLIEKIIVAEFEPGIIDAYIGEDKLHQLMSYMDNRPFWVTRMQIKGSQRVYQSDLASLTSFQRRNIGTLLKTAPGWCEIDYINNFENSNLGIREHLLGWVFSSIKGEHGFALHLAKTGKSIFGELLFDELNRFSRKSLTHGYLKLGFRAIRNILSQHFRRN